MAPGATMKLTLCRTHALLAVLWLTAACDTAVDPHQAMNLLIIQTDEHHYGTLGIYGGEIVDTPNIDWIGENGAIATSFYATTPVCSPSRASLISGLYPQNAHVSNNNSPMRKDVVTFAETLRQSGYATGYAGKWHLNGKIKPDWAPEPRFGFADNRFMFNRGHWKKLEDGPTGPRVGGRDSNGEPTYSLSDADEQTYTTDWLANKTIDFIREHRDGPFSFLVSIPDPHGPNVVRPPYNTMFDDVEVPIPASLNKSDSQTPTWAPHDPDVDEAALRRFMKQYYGMVKCIDDNVGRILAAMRDLDLLDQTIIVFTSDHGDMCGEHCRVNKGLPYEGSARIPFLMRFPGKLTPGTVIEEALGTVDFTPTVLSLMGIESDVNYDGRDASALLTGDAREWEDIAIVRSAANENKWISAMSDRYKLVLSATGPPWLFDTFADPDELTNLFGRPEHADLSARFARHIRDYAARYDDPFAQEPNIMRLIESLAN
jgi:arylsulfatase A-like enzyme